MNRAFVFVALTWVAITLVVAGPNHDAGIAVDLDPFSPEIDSIDTTGEQSLLLAVSALDAVDLDSYSFELHYDPAVLEFVSASAEDPFQGMENMLKRNGGSILAMEPDTSREGVVGFSCTLTSDNAEDAPEGKGLLAVILFNVREMNKSCTLTVSSTLFCDWEQVCDSVSRAYPAYFAGQSPTHLVRYPLRSAAPGRYFTGRMMCDPRGRILRPEAGRLRHIVDGQVVPTVSRSGLQILFAVPLTGEYRLRALSGREEATDSRKVPN